MVENPMPQEFLTRKYITRNIKRDGDPQWQERIGTPFCFPFPPKEIQGECSPLSHVRIYLKRNIPFQCLPGGVRYEDVVTEAIF
jgi:hypothetical protein